MNTCLPNGNGYGEINLKIDDMALQTAFSHLFNPPPCYDRYLQDTMRRWVEGMMT